mmetsp:Transcript_34582/g.68073  ORF Transcript_34582/g.68073 Transcript_34582/m.68073 type:complete len:250 (-) Transcript_34582:1228-1977(-)
MLTPRVKRGGEPRRHLRVGAVELDHRVRDELVPRPIGTVKSGGVGPRKHLQEASDRIRVGRLVPRMRCERAHRLHAVGHVRRCLHLQPLVDHQRLPVRHGALVEGFQGFFTRGAGHGGQARQGGNGIGHARGRAELSETEVYRVGPLQRGEQVQTRVAQAASADLFLVHGIRRVSCVQRAVQLEQRTLVLSRQRLPYKLQRTQDCVSVDRIHLLCKCRIPGHRQRVRNQGRVQRLIGQCRSESIPHGRI